MPAETVVKSQSLSSDVSPTAAADAVFQGVVHARIAAKGVGSIAVPDAAKIVPEAGLALRNIFNRDTGIGIVGAIEQDDDNDAD